MVLMWGGEWYLPSKHEEFMLSGGFEKRGCRWSGLRFGIGQAI